MKECAHIDLKIGKMYDTLRPRTYSRLVYAQPKRSKEFLCGECHPEDTFVLLGLLNDDLGLKWTKILTSKGVVGWTLWIESLDTYPAFVEI